MKSYRTRNLSQRCQIAKTEDGVTPLRDEQGNYVLDHGGLCFLKVSGGDHCDRKRVIPVDHEAFFALKAKEFTDALKAEGVTDTTVTPAEIYAEFVAAFTKPAHTYAPAGKPEEFSIVLPKTLCVNWTGAVGGVSRGIRPGATIAPQATSLFAKLRATKLEAAQTPAVKKKAS